jgi:hypothetical protein
MGFPDGARRKMVMRLGDVLTAAADQRDVPDLQLEVVEIANPCHERVELAGGNVVDAAALLADEMAVCAREMEERRTVRLVHVFDESPFVQRVKCPVHGRKMNFRVRVVHASRQIIGGEMFGGAREQLDHEPAGRRDAAAFGA